MEKETVKKIWLSKLGDGPSKNESPEHYALKRAVVDHIAETEKKTVENAVNLEFEYTTFEGSRIDIICRDKRFMRIYECETISGIVKELEKKRPEFKQYKIALVIPDLPIDEVWMVKEGKVSKKAMPIVQG